MSNKHIDPLFPVWCHKILPLVYDESLSYYEVLCKLQQKLNEVVKSQNNLQDEFYQLKEWIDTQLEKYSKEQLDELLDDGTLENIINEHIFNDLNTKIDNFGVVNVKNFGAKGDGVTDDTQSILNAINSLTKNTVLYFPAGDYIVYNDYTPNYNEYAYDYNKLIKIENMENICIMGSSKETCRIRPSYQAPYSSKLNYPCTLSIVNSKNIDIKDITIESKGENYGDTDNGVTHSDLENRKKQMCVNGGQSILLLSSTNIFIENIIARLCGSVGVIYSSSCNNVIMNNIFVNPMSLGYAGICEDYFYNEIESSKSVYFNVVQHSEKIYQDENYGVLKGSETYSGKCCFLNEGNQNTNMMSSLFNFDVSDCFGGSPDYTEGYAVGSANANTYVNGLNVRNCYYALTTRNVFNGFKTFVSNMNAYVKIAGIFINEQVSNDSSLEIYSSYIKCDGSFNPETSSIECIKYGSALCCRSYQSKGVSIYSSKLYGTEKAIYFPHNISYLTIKNSYINGDMVGDIIGGNITFQNNELEFTNIENGLLINTTDSAGIVNNLYYYIVNNIFYSSTQGNALKISNTNGTQTLIKDTVLSNNNFSNCYANGNFIIGNNTLIGQFLELKETAVAGSYYVLIFNPIGALISTSKCAIINNNGSINTSIAGASFEGSKIKYYFNTDIRSGYTIGDKYMVFNYKK